VAGCISIDYTVVGVALIRRGAVSVPHLGAPVARLRTIDRQTE
jgi:hypothetical protein